MNEQTELETPKIAIPTDKAGKQAFWAKEVSRWKRSGQSQRAYSRQRGLVFHQFNDWIAKLRAPNPMTKKPLGECVPVQVAAETKKEGFRIKRPDGLMIALPLLKDMHYLKAILEVLAC